MKPSENRILEEALELSPEARAAMAGSLLESLEESLDPDAEAQWETEVAQRVKQIERGTVRLVPWSEARRIILARRPDCDRHPTAPEQGPRLST